MDMGWDYLFYSDLLEAHIRGMLPVHRARLAHIRRLIENQGPNLGHPHTESFGGGLFEMRLKGPDTIARIFFCFLKGNRIVFLHVFIKKTQKTPEREICLARKRMEEVNLNDKAREEEEERAANEKRE